MQRRVHYVLSTHWDREWHQTFQDFRYRLVRLIDRVIAGWEDGRLQGPFQTDGQAIILEDYLEVRPERRVQLQQLAMEGKLVIGPWYVLPDEFAVSGEALIRNLRLGREIARAFGAEPSAAGFVCDCFGHISQLPQVFAGFGIRGGFIWRGTNTHGQRNVLWQGADGTVLPCVRFGPVGYCDYAVQVRRAHEHANDSHDAVAFLQRLDDYVTREAKVTEVEPILAFDGCDHQEWDAVAYRHLLHRMNQQAADAAQPYEIVHTSLDAYLVEMLPQQERIKTLLQGELREPGWESPQPGQRPRSSDEQWVIPGVFSSRVNLKQANARCQTMLCHWAEPLSAFASSALGVEYPQGYLNLAWRWLLQNHPHDSIDGCSIDQVHRDMVYRFDQSRMISERLTAEATHQIGASVAGELTDHELRVVVFNSLPRPMNEVVELDLQIPPHWPKFNEFFGFEPKPAFRIFDAAGEELSYQRLGQELQRKTFRLRDTRFPETVVSDIIQVAVRLTIPALGYTTLCVRAGYPGERTRHPSAPGLATSESSMANEYLDVHISSNGSLTITDKRTGQVYHRVLTFEDAADIGDGWYHGVATNDQVFISTGCPTQVALVHDTPLLTTFRVRTRMLVPRAFEFGRMRRSEELAELVIDNLITLRQGQDTVKVRTTVHNVARDHRLRVLLPSGAQAATYLADGQFDVLERPIALREDNHLYRELEVETKPQHSWTAVFDRERGLAVVTDGLLETAVRDLPERPLALTLLRATGRTVGTDGEPDGQLQGSLTFDYWLVPLSENPDLPRLCELGQRISAGLQVAQLWPQDLPLHRTVPTLRPSAGFLRLEGAAVLTSARLVDGALEVRLFNPLQQRITVRISIDDWPESTPGPSRMQGVDFESNPLEGSVPLQMGSSITLEHKQIVTLRLD